MERYQIGSAGKSDIYFNESQLKGMMVGDDMISKLLEISPTGEVVNTDFIEIANELYCLDGCSANGRIVYAGDNNEALTANLSDPKSHSVFCEYLGKVWDISLDKEGIRACLVGDDKNPILFNFELNKKLTFESEVPCSLISCKWSPDSRTFAVVGKNGILTLYTVDDEFTEIKKLQQWKITEKDIKEDFLHGINPQFISEDKLIVAGKDCLQVITRSKGIWSYSTSSKIKHQGLIYQVALLRDNFIATVGQDKKISLWNLTLELKLKVFDISYKAMRIRFIASYDMLIILDDLGQVFTATNVISGSNRPVAEQEDQTLDEASNKEISTAAPFAGEEKSSRVEVGNLKLENRMDEERRSGDIAKFEPDQNSNYRIEDEKVGFDSFVSNKNRNLVYDEAEEADMRRKAGILEDLDSRYGRSQQKAARPKREDNAAQPAFIPGSTTGTGDVRSKRHYICYNMYGKVMWRTSNDKCIIESEYSLGTLSKQGILNEANFTMACINYKGVLLASAGEVIQEDEYIDEEKTEKQRISTLFFASADRKRNWEVSFGKQENIQNIALGLYCSAVYTNKKIIRIFTPDGKEDQLFGFNKPVIGMSMYENLLAIVYHETQPFSGNQMAKVQIINLSSREVTNDREIVLSYDSKIKWFGFSEEGIFYVQDSKFMLWGQQNQSLWAPVFDGAKEANMWIIGVSDQTIIYLKLPYGELEPSLFIDYPPSNTQFRPPFINDEGKARFLELLKYDQNRLRNSYFSHTKSTSIYGEVTLPEDPMTINRQTIKSEDDVEKLTLEVDKINIDRARVALIKGDEEAAIFYGLQLENSKTLEICLRLFESLGHARVAERLKIESDKLGNVQFKLKAGSIKKYIPQLVLQTTTANDVNQNNQLTDIGLSRTMESANLLAYNSSKMNKSSFADVVDENRPKQATTLKMKASESSKEHEDEKPQKKTMTSHDLFRDLSEMTKVKR